MWDALDGQTKALSDANGRTADVVAMVDACDARQADVLAGLQPQRRGLTGWLHRK